MRDKLNSNPVAQAAVIGVLLLSAAFFLVTTMGRGGEEEEGGSSPESLAIVNAESTATQPPTPGALADASPPPPAEVTDAFAAGNIVVLLFVRDGGIDDRMVEDATESLSGLPEVSTFVVPVSQIARYASIAQGVDVERVPALVVIRPKRVDKKVPSASVQYGYQSPASVEQAIIDAGYEGPTLNYHP
ncbi:MAG TPA: hypothetical protein VIT85_05140 [Solirubrobacterales bacterium]